MLAEGAQEPKGDRGREVCMYYLHASAAYQLVSTCLAARPWPWPARRPPSPYHLLPESSWARGLISRNAAVRVGWIACDLLVAASHRATWHMSQRDVAFPPRTLPTIPLATGSCNEGTDPGAAAGPNRNVWSRPNLRDVPTFTGKKTRERSRASI